MPSVLDCLHYGRENAVSRYFLTSMTGLDDRTVRDVIKHLRVNEGYPIFNTLDGKGYFLATKEDANEMKAALQAQKSRTREDMRLLKAYSKSISKVLNPEGLQMEL